LEETADVLARLTELFEYENTTLFNTVVPPESVRKTVRNIYPPTGPAQPAP